MDQPAPAELHSDEQSLTLPRPALGPAAQRIAHRLHLPEDAIEAGLWDWLLNALDELLVAPADQLLAQPELYAYIAQYLPDEVAA